MLYSVIKYGKVSCGELSPCSEPMPSVASQERCFSRGNINENFLSACRLPYCAHQTIVFISVPLPYSVKKMLTAFSIP